MIKKIVSIGNFLPFGKYKIHSKFKNVINFYNSENKIISISNNDIYLNPNSIILQNYDIHSIKNIEIISPVRCFPPDSRVIIDNNEFKIEQNQIYNSSFTNFPKINKNKLNENIEVFINKYLKLFSDKSLSFLIDYQREKYFITSFERAFCEHSKKAFLIFQKKNYIESVKMFKGSGFGLTPSGDDFISGILLGLYVIENLFNQNLSNLRKKIFNASKGNNLLSNSFLYFAYKGAYSKKIKEFQHAFLNNQTDNIETSLKQLLSIGETSGADMLTGYFLTMKIRLIL